MEPTASTTDGGSLEGLARGPVLDLAVLAVALADQHRAVDAALLPARNDRYMNDSGRSPCHMGLKAHMAAHGKPTNSYIGRPNSTQIEFNPLRDFGLLETQTPSIPRGARISKDSTAAVLLEMHSKSLTGRTVLEHRQRNPRTAGPVRRDRPSARRCLSPMMRKVYVGVLGEGAVATSSPYPALEGPTR